jgi:hypothetical protein
MDSALTAIVVTLWLSCGVLTYGGLFAYLQEQYPSQTETEYRGDRRYPIFPALFGPVGLIVVALATRYFKYGFKFS